MTRDPHDSNRSRLVIVESIGGAILVIGGVLLGRVGGVVDYVGLLIVFFGGWALVHAILVGSGLINPTKPTATRSGPPAQKVAADPLALRTRRERIIRIEIISGAGSAVIGAAFQAGGHTLGQVSLVLFGWAARVRSAPDADAVRGHARQAPQPLLDRPCGPALTGVSSPRSRSAERSARWLRVWLGERSQADRRAGRG